MGENGRDLGHVTYFWILEPAYYLWLGWSDISAINVLRCNTMFCNFRCFLLMIKTGPLHLNVKLMVSFYNKYMYIATPCTVNLNTHISVWTSSDKQVSYVLLLVFFCFVYILCYMLHVVNKDEYKTINTLQCLPLPSNLLKSDHCTATFYRAQMYVMFQMSSLIIYSA